MDKLTLLMIIRAYKAFDSWARIKQGRIFEGAFGPERKDHFLERLEAAKTIFELHWKFSRTNTYKLWEVMPLMSGAVINVDTVEDWHQLCIYFNTHEVNELLEEQIGLRRGENANFGTVENWCYAIHQDNAELVLKTVLG